MKDVDRYQRDFEILMQEVEAKAAVARQAKNVEVFEQLLAAADQVGIERPRALARIEFHPDSYKAGAMALIEDIRTRAAATS